VALGDTPEFARAASIFVGGAAPMAHVTIPVL
jgi:hypothetical protein